MQPTRNVVELLAPFLAPQPSHAGDQHDSSACTSGPATTAATASSCQLAAEQEEQAVRLFLVQHKENSGLHAVAAALLNLLMGNKQPIPISSIAKEVMDLETLIRGESNLTASNNANRTSLTPLQSWCTSASFSLNVGQCCAGPTLPSVAQMQGN